MALGQGSSKILSLILNLDLVIFYLSLHLI